MFDERRERDLPPLLGNPELPDSERTLLSTAPLQHLAIWEEVTDLQLWHALLAFHEDPLNADEIELHKSIQRVRRIRGYEGTCVPPFSIATLETYWKVEHCYLRAFEVLNPLMEL